MSEPTSTTTSAGDAGDTETSRVPATTSNAKALECHDINQATSSTHKAQAQVSPGEEGLIKEMKNFDNLLRMISVYRDNPDLRGNPQDRNIEEIAKVLSNFIGDDPDNFLRDEDDEDDEDDAGRDSDSNDKQGDNQVTSNGDSSKDSSTVDKDES